MKIVFFSASLLLLLGACADSSSVTAQGPDTAQASSVSTSPAVVADTMMNNPVPATASALPSFRMRNGRGEIVDMDE